MGTRLSPTIMRRKDLCDIVVAATRVQRPMVAASEAEILQPFLRPDETPPDLDKPIELHGRRLSFLCDEMVWADQAHSALLAEKAQLRVVEEAQMGSAKGMILSVRFACLGLVGEEILGPLALDFRVGRTSRDVLRQGEIIRDRFRNLKEEDFLQVTWAPGPLVPQQVAEELEGRLQPLRETRQKLVDVQKRIDVALVVKHEKTAAFEAGFLPTAQMLEAEFRVAGHTELADRIRPTVRRLTRADEAVEEGAEPEAPQPEPSDSDAETEVSTASER